MLRSDIVNFLFISATESPLIDYISVAAVVSGFSLYHLINFRSILWHCANECFVQPNVLRSSTDLVVLTALRWMRRYKRRGDYNTVLLAIHTFRNILLVVIFIGGIAFREAIRRLAVLNLKKRGDSVSFKIVIQNFALSVFLVSSFLSFSLVIRFLSHLGFLLCTLAYRLNIHTTASNLQDIEGGEHVDGIASQTSERVAQPNPVENVEISDFEGSNIRFEYAQARRMIKLAVACSSLGYRLLFMALPFYFYMTPPTLLASFVVIMAWLYKWDRNFHGS